MPIRKVHLCASPYTAENLPTMLQEELGVCSGVRQALRNALLRCDKEWLSLNAGQAGSTAIVVYHDGYGILSCANVGDSRAVLCRAGVAVPLSFPQVHSMFTQSGTSSHG